MTKGDTAKLFMHLIFNTFFLSFRDFLSPRLNGCRIPWAPTWIMQGEITLLGDAFGIDL